MCTNMATVVWMLKSLGINDYFHFDFMDTHWYTHLTTGTIVYIGWVKLFWWIKKLRRRMALEEKRRELNNKEVCLERNEKKSQFRKTERWSWYPWEGEYVENTGVGLECIKDAKSKLTSDQAGLSKLAMIERIFWFEILNKFLKWMDERRYNMRCSIEWWLSDCIDGK